MDPRWSRSSLLYLVLLAVFGDAAAQGNFSLQTAVIIVGGIAAIYIVVCIVLFLALCRVLNMKCCHRGKVCPITPATKEKRKERKKDYLEIAGTKGLGKSTKRGPVVRKLEKIPEEGTDDDVIAIKNLAYDEQHSEESSSLSESNNTSRNSSSNYQQKLRDIKSAATVITNLDTDDSISIPSSPTDNSLTYI